MNTSSLRQQVKPWILPIAMVIGIVAHEWIGYVAFLSPWLIFVMLLITFCRVNPREFKVSRFTWCLLAVQVAGSIAVYSALAPLSVDVAQGVFICIFCPTATAAPVVTGMLGGSVSRLVTYSLISNVTVALLSPMLFSLMGAGSGVGFVYETLTISGKVLPLILSPLVIAFLLCRFAPKAHRAIADHQSLSFYIWAVALIIVVGNAVRFVISEPSDRSGEMIVIAVGALLACCLQFYAGRKVGSRLGDKISGAQALGQKNTVLAIWMALTYLNPISSVGPAAYVAWQNTINSLQLFYKNRQGKQS